MYFEDYKEKILEKLDLILKNEKENIETAAELIVEAFSSEKNVYIFGCNHSAIIAQEVFYRAGSLALYIPIFSPGLNFIDTKPLLTTYMERNEKLGEDIVRSSRIKKGDVVIVVSTSGRNPAPVEFAIRSKELGAKLIAITSRKFSESFPSRHSSGKKLIDVPPDVVIDNYADPGDVSVEVVEKRMGPTSSITGIFIIHLISMTVAKKLKDLGIDPPVFISSNVPGGDEVNNRLVEEYEQILKMP